MAKTREKATPAEQIKWLKRLSQQAAAVLLGMTPRTLREKDCPRNDDGRTFDGPKAVQWLVGASALQDDERRLAAAKAATAELELDKRRGVLIEREVIERRVGQLLEQLRTLGDHFGRTATMTGRDAQERLNEVLERLADDCERED